MTLICDITEDKQVEDVLRQDQEQGIEDAVIATDSKGHVTFLNTVAGRITGSNFSEETGKPVQGMFQAINEETGAGSFRGSITRFRAAARHSIG